MKQCLIIGSAPMKDLSVFSKYDPKNSFIICADGGLDTAKAAKLSPNLVIGDFDSAKCEPPASVEVIRLQREKDDTDMMCAVKEGIRRGFQSLVLFGAAGGREDHTYANYCALEYISSQGRQGEMVMDHTHIFIMTRGRMLLRQMKGATVSVFPFGTGMCSVTYRGMKYRLEEGVLISNNPRGTSNVLINDDASITLHSGHAIIFVLDHV
jgi:thiamine pyrophosphokinase